MAPYALGFYRRDILLNRAPLGATWQSHLPGLAISSGLATTTPWAR